ncbi:MAG: PucR family transcriptional regulator [Actinomycetes bacterium]
MPASSAVPRLTVRTLLGVPELRLTVAAGAEGLDRPLRWAHSTELLDPSPYLRGGELVLTVGAGLTTPSRCEDFANAVVRGGASAIGYGCGDVLPAPPDALVAACERRQLPLLEVPPDVPFVAFTEWLAERLAQAHDQRAARVSAGRLIELVRADLAAPAALRPVLLAVGVDPDGPLVVAARSLQGDTGLDEAFADGDWHGNDSPYRGSDDAGGTNDAEKPRGAVLVAVTQNHVLLLGDERAVLAAVEPEPRSPWRVSGSHELGRLTVALVEAERALVSGGSQPRVVRHAELSTLSALLERLPVDVLRPFVDELAAPLLAHDRDHHSDLVRTLDAFVAAGGSVTDTARALYLHPNSVRLRLQRVRSLTGRDPMALDDLIALRIALVAAAQ